jgi:hypothetical protein
MQIRAHRRKVIRVIQSAITRADRIRVVLSSVLAQTAEAASSGQSANSAAASGIASQSSDPGSNASPLSPSENPASAAAASSGQSASSAAPSGIAPRGSDSPGSASSPPLNKNSASTGSQSAATTAADNAAALKMPILPHSHRGRSQLSHGECLLIAGLFIYAVFVGTAVTGVGGFGW